LNPGGVMVLEQYAGPEACMTGSDIIELDDDLIAIWEQESFNAVTHQGINYLHFRSADGQPVAKPFVYDFRIWSLPELSDLLYEAGFGQLQFFQMGGEVTGNLEACSSAEIQDHWTVHIAAFA